MKMKAKCLVAFAGLVVILFLGCPSTATSEQGGIAGTWQGTLSIAETELRIVFKIAKGEGGALTATMDSPDQGASDIPVDEVSFEAGRLRLELKALQGVYEGKLTGGAIDGEWTQGEHSFPLKLERTGKPAQVRRPQEPKKPYPYAEEDVQFDNAGAMLTLAGTLTMPKSGVPHPAVVLISGSGPQDRNEEVFGHKPFLVLADYLTRRGVAVLRFDDRGVGKSGGDRETATSEDFSTDVIAAVEFLKTRDEIDPLRIGLVGHSEGGIIAPMVGVRYPGIAFIVLMAGSGLPGEDILYRQGELLMRAGGDDEEVIAGNRAIQEAVFAVVKSDRPKETLAGDVEAAIADALAGLSGKAKEVIEARLTEQVVEQQVEAMTSPWIRFFVVHDPRLVLQKVKAPVLAINGEKDLQVPAEENLAAIEAALAAGGNPDYTVKELPGLNHLFQTAATGAVEEYARIEETIAPVALKTIGDWIAERVK
jgi:pimeloyl-ACP methyl ester carboxylesterase